MRWITLFVIGAGLIVVAAGIGTWAASTTTRAKAANVEDTRARIPIGGGHFVLPLVY